MESPGKQIIELRKKFKLSQSQIGEKLGISAQSVSQIEKGGSVRTITMQRLAELVEELESNSSANLSSKKSWYEAKIEQLEETVHKQSQIIDRLTRMLENAHLGKPFDVILGGLANLDGYEEAKVVSIFSEVANSVTSEAQRA